jgi:hypothetical protein
LSSPVFHPIADFESKATERSRTALLRTALFTGVGIPHHITIGRSRIRKGISV